MIKFKKIIGLSLAMIITFAFAFFSTKDVFVFASASGNGWSLDESGNLTVTSDKGIINWATADNHTRYYEKVLKLNITDGVTRIDTDAFRYLINLQEVNISSTVTYIGESSFYDCRKLKSIVIPEGVNLIGYYAFGYCASLENVFISASVEKIGAGAFSNCEKLKEIVVDKNNKHYTTGSNGEIFNKNMTMLIQYPAGNPANSYVVSDSIRIIEANAFQGASNLVDIKLSENVDIIGDYAFSGCDNLIKIIIPNGVAEIKRNTFFCSFNLTEVIIPDSVIKISGLSFFSCRKLNGVEIPNSVIQIDELAFSCCYELKSIIFRSKLPPDISSNALPYSGEIETVYVPRGTKELYSTELEGKIPDDAQIIEVAADFTLESVNNEDGPIADEKSKYIIVFLPIILLVGCATVLILRQRKKRKSK